MASDVAPTECSTCGAVLARSEMFGPDDALQCPACAQGIRQRMEVRVRMSPREWANHNVTKAVIGICVVLFGMSRVALSGGKNPEWLWALVQRETIWTGEAWRHLSVVFLHFDFFHVGMNMFSTWYVCRILEQFWGPKITIGVILATGISASALSWMMEGAGIGFSGALFGICGFLWGQRRHHPVAYHVMDQRFKNLLLTWLVIGVVLSQTGTLPIGNWAHGGGLVSGYVLGVLADGRRRWLSPAVGVLMVIGLVLAAQFFAFGSVERGGREYARAEMRRDYIKAIKLRDEFERRAKQARPGG
jgi:membrane associated rhomboid family serine protease